jgi:23S rRNA (cytidine1920-2'-O)/16S rRNA (cytidine1409-2'-O)-methyltransferase
MKYEEAKRRTIDLLPARFSPADSGPLEVNGVVIDVDVETGQAKMINRIREGAELPSRDKAPRLDVYLVLSGQFESREKAQAAILAGEVLVNENVVSKCGSTVAPDAVVRVKSKSPYVGRGALKIIKALDEFRIDVTGKIAIDVGASPGGFTQALLERGASLVYAVDVGTNQLDWKLRSAPRVRSMEKTNARSLDPARFDPQPSVAGIDVSFISIVKILESVLSVMDEGFVVAALIKPQFELEPSMISDGGFVKPEYRQTAIDRGVGFAKSLGLESSEVIESPIVGARSGNVEFLVRFKRS